MAFTQETFAPISSPSTESPSFWGYSTNDFVEVVIAPGYFEDKKIQIRDGDFIYLSAGNGAYVVRYKGVDATQTLLAPSSTLAPDVVLNSQSTITQGPTALDTPVKINFGPPQGEPTDPVSLDAGGNININQSGVYQFIGLFSVSRQTSGGEAYFFIRALINGVPFNNPVAVIIDDGEETSPLELVGVSSLSAGDVITLEMYRDSQSGGANDGFLESWASTIGWGNSSSASVTIVRFS